MTWPTGDVTSPATPPTQPLVDVVSNGNARLKIDRRCFWIDTCNSSPAWVDATLALFDTTPVFVDTNPLLVDAFLAIVGAILAVVDEISVRGSDVISKLITLQRPFRLGLPEEEINRPQPAVDTARPSYPIRNNQALTELKRDEMGCLLLTTFSIALGIALLLDLQTHFDLGLEYLNSHSTLLYLLSSLVKISSAWVNSSPREKSWLSSSFCKSLCSRAQFPTSNVTFFEPRNQLIPLLTSNYSPSKAVNQVGMQESINELARHGMTDPSLLEELQSDLDILPLADFAALPFPLRF
ncbi:hypothetical protein PCASD_22531 [Puccinia coronata f. sp. avenae]|uniref:Uncharacterized protein n=1 Tax=Puccinia coronata f. sp. avenae TaxID=200324 RepID=A0A2N5THS3_9BASI|nr:hypothetical protein PCASD_22531 [Puccinia coronata f. sp. avenae]